MDERTVDVPVTIGADGVARVDLRGLHEGVESVVGVAAAPGLAARVGRDLLGFGEIDDFDVEEDWLEVSRWDVEADSRYPCIDAPFRGVAALCSERDASNDEPSIITFRHRVRLMNGTDNAPIRDLSLFGHAAGEGAGPVEVQIEVRASEGDRTWGSTTVWSHPEGDFGWEGFAVDLLLPEEEAPASDVENNPRAVQLRLQHSPPSRGLGLARFDDLAVVSWDPTPLDLSQDRALDAPNLWDFLRIEGPPGDHLLRVRISAPRSPSEEAR